MSHHPPCGGQGSPHRRGRFSRKGDMGEDGGADLYEAKVRGKPIRGRV